MNLQHPAIVQKGEGWAKFKSTSPDTLDEILDDGEIINRLTNEGEGNWYVEWEIIHGPQHEGN